MKIVCKCGRGLGALYDGLCTKCRKGVTAWEAWQKTKPTPDPRIAEYINEINTPGVVSYSHQKLSALRGKCGISVVDGLLADYFKQEREWNASRTRMATAGEASRCGDEVQNQA